MDLRTGYPRSVRETWQGVVQLGRTIDKGKAKAKGDIGDYTAPYVSKRSSAEIRKLEQRVARPRARGRIARGLPAITQRNRARSQRRHYMA